MLIEATFANRPESRTALEELLPEGVYERGVELEAPPGTIVRYEGMIISRGIDVAPVLQFVMDVGPIVTAELIVAWILRRFHRAETVSIDHREVHLDDEGQVRLIVEDAIKIER